MRLTGQSESARFSSFVVPKNAMNERTFFFAHSHPMVGMMNGASNATMEEQLRTTSTMWKI